MPGSPEYGDARQAAGGMPGDSGYGSAGQEDGRTGKENGEVQAVSAGSGMSGRQAASAKESHKGGVLKQGGALFQNESGGRGSFRSGRGPDRADYKRAVKRSDNPDVVYGRDFDEQAMNIEDIIGEMGEVVIRGRSLIRTRGKSGMKKQSSFMTSPILRIP